MSAATDEKRAKPIEVIAELRVELSPPRYVGCGIPRDDLERHGKALDAWAVELEQFIRDHRSQDAVDISVERVKETVCSVCRRTWETYDPDNNGVLACANCGAVVDTGE